MVPVRRMDPPAMVGVSSTPRATISDLTSSRRRRQNCGQNGNFLETLAAAAVRHPSTPLRDVTNSVSASTRASSGAMEDPPVENAPRELEIR